jgi:hypothetical protein
MGFVSVSALTSPWIAGCESWAGGGSWARVAGTSSSTSLTSWWCTLASEFGPLGGDPS